MAAFTYTSNRVLFIDVRRRLLKIATNQRNAYDNFYQRYVNLYYLNIMNTHEVT